MFPKMDMAKEREEMGQWTTDTTTVILDKKNLDGVITLEDDINKQILEPPEEDEMVEKTPQTTAEAENNAKEAENSLKESKMMNHSVPSNSAEVPEEGDQQGSPRMPRKGVSSPPKVSPKGSPKACTSTLCGGVAFADYITSCNCSQVNRLNVQT